MPVSLLTWILTIISREWKDLGNFSEIMGTLQPSIFYLKTGNHGPWNGMVGWIATGIPYDLIHGLSNVMAGLLVLPLAELMKRQLKRSR